ncbi:MAG TPA: Calx-beta domain-containing protein [Pyrinomonadaceae bacterium]|jgi:hypothetical protein
MPEEYPPPGVCRDAVSAGALRRVARAAAPALLLAFTFFCFAGAASARQLPVLSVKPASVNEGDSGSTDVPVTVELSAPSSQTVTVQYRTVEYTAFAGSDFQHVTGTLTFAPGVTQRTVNVPVLGDTVDELDEYLFVQLSNATNAGVSVSSNPPLLFIYDDDPTPRDTRLSATNYSFDEGAGVASVVVRRTGDLSVASSVNYSTGDISATQAQDYTAAYGTLTFAPGESEKAVNVFITNDRWKENATEVFHFRINTPVNTAIGGDITGSASGAASVAIRDDDTADGANPVRGATFDPEFFVRQHYRDFLGRDPDAAGLAHWINQTTNCGAADPQVCRNNVSAAFFLSIEFQQTGYLVYLTREAAFDMGEYLALRDFQSEMPKLSRGLIVGQAGWEEQLEANKQAFFREFVEGPLRGTFEFMTPAQVVDRMNQNTGGVLSQAERDQLVAQLSADNTTETRARVLRAVVEDPDFAAKERSRAFVLMQYFGYLRRKPNDWPERTFDFTGYNYWLSKLNSHGGDYIRAEMVQAFITSAEYEQRFAP